MDHNSYNQQEEFFKEKMRKIEEHFTKASPTSKHWDVKPKKTKYKYDEESDYGSMVDKRKKVVPRWTPEDQALEDILWAS